MSYNSKNYTEQGGEKTIIGGEIDIVEGGKLKFGGVRLKQVQGQSDSEASSIATLKQDFNELMAKLQVAGLMERAFITLEQDSEVDNKINTLATYTNVSGDSDAWVADAIIKSSEPIPAGTKVTINNPAIGGEHYVVESASRTLWLSDVIKGQNEDVGTRTKLNLHTAQAFDFTVSGLTEDLAVDLTFFAVTSYEDGLAGTKQSDKDFGNYIVLTSNTLTDVTFKAEE